MTSVSLRVRTFALALAATAAASALAAPAEAGTVSLLYDPTGADAYSSGAGGEFIGRITGIDVPAMGPGVKILPDTAAYQTFQTFCLEYSEHFVPGVTYSWTMSTEAKNGGASGQFPVGSATDPLDARTAYLYTQFWRGALSQYDYVLGSTNRSVTSAQLQNAIWYLEGERTLAQIGGVTSQAYLWVTEATTAVSSGGSWHQRWGANGLGNVRVLNLTDTAGNPVQDQLFLVPVPPAALLGLGMLGGIGGIGVLRKRRRRAYDAD